MTTRPVSLTPGFGMGFNGRTPLGTRHRAKNHQLSQAEIAGFVPRNPTGQIREPVHGVASAPVIPNSVEAAAWISGSWMSYRPGPTGMPYTQPAKWSRHRPVNYPKEHASSSARQERE